MVQKSILTTRYGRVFGASVGDFKHGTGGSKRWWQAYDAAKAYFDANGSLNGFPNTYWIRETVKARNGGRLCDDQIHYLKEINFDFAPAKAPRKPKGNKLSRTLELKKRFEDAHDALSDDEKSELLYNLKHYRTKWLIAELSNGSAKSLGLNDNGNCDSVIRDLS